jgi:hypothetical protein
MPPRSGAQSARPTIRAGLADHDQVADRDRQFPGRFSRVGYDGVR